MKRTLIEKICPCCKEKFKTLDKRQKFCGRACAARYNNTGRTPTKEHRQKVSKGLKKFYEKNPNAVRKGAKAAKVVAKHTKGRYGDPKNIYDMSARTRVKIMHRLDIPCSRCGWNEAIGDIHHIEGRKINDPHNHKKLSYLCPNCHRLAETGNIMNNEFVTFETQVGNAWKKLYYG